MSMNIFELLMYEEGYRRKPYLDSEGYITIGIGHKLLNVKGVKPEDVNLEMSQLEAKDLLLRKVNIIKFELKVGPYGETYKHLSEPRKVIIQSMCYQMGIKGVYKFKKMWGALFLGKYRLAEKEALNSKWAKQTKGRAKRHAKVIRTSEWKNYYGVGI